MTIPRYNPEKPNGPGYWQGEPNNAYHRNPAISASKLSLYMECPELFREYVIQGKPKPRTDAMRFGSLFHHKLLEPATFYENYADAPTPLWRSKDDKAASVEALNKLLIDPLPAHECQRLAGLKKEDIEAEFAKHPGMEIATPEDLEKASAMVASVRANPLANWLLTGGTPEVTFRTGMLSETTKNPHVPFDFALQCKCDWLNLDGNKEPHTTANDITIPAGAAYWADVKTIEDMSRWRTEFIQRGYYRTWTLYYRTIETVLGYMPIEHWFWIFVEKSSPFRTFVFRPTKACWNRGVDEYSKGLQSLNQSLKTGRFDTVEQGTLLEADIPDSSFPKYFAAWGDPFCPGV